MKAFGLPLDSEIKNTRASQMQQARLGALVGFTVGVAFAVAASSVDLLLYRDLPLGFEINFLLTYGLVVIAAMSVVGFVTCWAVETWRGLAYGAVAVSLFVLVGSLLQTDMTTVGAKIIAILFIVMPLAVLALPIAWILRWLTDMHMHARFTRFSTLKIALLAIVALALGAAGGWFMRMPSRAADALHFMNGMIRIAPDHEDSVLRKVDGFGDHMGASYALYETSSTVSTEGFDVTAVYEDGYRLSCTVVIFPGRDPYLSVCKGETERP